MSVILCISGKKKSGKGVLSNHLLNNFHELTPFKTARIYSFASAFKRIAVEVLGLPSKLVYGSNEDKEQYCDYLWENLPHYPRIIKPIQDKYSELENLYCRSLISQESFLEQTKDLVFPTGRMKIRNMLQELGTGMFRILDEDIWVKTLIRQIENEKYDLAIIDDCRFPNELNGVLNYSSESKVIRLTRKVSDDQHISETALDGPHPFSFVLDNAKLTEQETKDAFDNYLRSIYDVR